MRTRGVWFQMVRFKERVALTWLGSGARMRSRTASISSSRSFSKCWTLEYLGERGSGQEGTCHPSTPPPTHMATHGHAASTVHSSLGA
jgi:hypothetical protein